MSVRPRLHACRRTPAPVGAPVHGSLHGPCIDLKPGVLLPTPTPTDGGEDGGGTLGARVREQGMKILDAGLEQWNERTVYDQASRQMFDEIDDGSWFKDRPPQYRKQKRKKFAEYVEKQAGNGFGKLQKAGALAPLQNRRSRLSNNYRQVGDYSQERANDFSKQNREYTVLEGLIKLVYKMVEKNQKKQEYTERLRNATSEVVFREGRLDIARQNLDDANKLRDVWANAMKELVKQLQKLEKDRTYITGRDLHDPDVVLDPGDLITQAMDDNALPLVNDELEEAELDEESKGDWADREARKDRKEFEETRKQKPEYGPPAGNYITARNIRQAQNLRGKEVFAPELTLAKKKAMAKQLKEAGELEGDWAERLAAAEREEREEATGVKDEQYAAQSDALRAKALREEVEKLLREEEPAPEPELTPAKEEEEEEEEEEEDDDDDNSEFSDDCEEREKTDNPCLGGAAASKEAGRAQKAAIAAARAKKEAAVDGDKWKPIPEVLGELWGDWAEFEINEERTTARRLLPDGEYQYATAIKDSGGFVTEFTFDK